MVKKRVIVLDMNNLKIVPRVFSVHDDRLNSWNVESKKELHHILAVWNPNKIYRSVVLKQVPDDDLHRKFSFSLDFTVGRKNF